MFKEARMLRKVTEIVNYGQGVVIVQYELLHLKDKDKAFG